MPSRASTTRLYHHGDLRQALIDAAMAIVTEEQDWGFSLREVARRANVSHNAPYNHFSEKRDLLDAVAAVGFDKLRSDMRSALSRSRDIEAALIRISQVYVGFAADNPALYRLMFGPELVQRESAGPALAKAAGAGAKMVLRDLIVKGAEDGRFDLAGEDDAAVDLTVLAVWAAVHGLAMLIIDNKSDQASPPREVAERVMRPFLKGLCKHEA